jgi:hypothetical protein
MTATERDGKPMPSTIRRRRFKLATQQAVYDTFLGDPTTRGDLHNSYKRGRTNLSAPDRATNSYAAWAAGQDHYRMAVAEGHPDPTRLPDELFARFSAVYRLGRTSATANKDT